MKKALIPILAILALSLCVFTAQASDGKKPQSAPSKVKFDIKKEAITGISTKMSYKIGEGNWKDVTSKTIQLTQTLDDPYFKGTKYYFKLKSTDKLQESEAVEISIPARRQMSESLSIDVNLELLVNATTKMEIMVGAKKYTPIKEVERVKIGDTTVSAYSLKKAPPKTGEAKIYVRYAASDTEPAGMAVYAGSLLPRQAKVDKKTTMIDCEKEALVGMSGMQYSLDGKNWYTDEIFQGQDSNWYLPLRGNLEAFINAKFGGFDQWYWLMVPISDKASTVFVRREPYVDYDAYTFASPSIKIKIPARPKVPKPKYDMIKETLTLKAGAEYAIVYDPGKTYEDVGAFMPFSEDKSQPLAARSFEQVFLVRNGATAKAFASLPARVTIPACSPNSTVESQLVFDYTAETVAAPATMQYTTSADGRGDWINITKKTPPFSIKDMIPDYGSSYNLYGSNQLWFRTRATKKSPPSVPYQIVPQPRVSGPTGSEYKFDPKNEVFNASNSLEYSIDNKTFTPVPSDGVIPATQFLSTSSQSIPIYFRVGPTANSYASASRAFSVYPRPEAPSVKVDYTTDTFVNAQNPKEALPGSLRIKVPGSSEYEEFYNGSYQRYKPSDFAGSTVSFVLAGDANYLLPNSKDTTVSIIVPGPPPSVIYDSERNEYIIGYPDLRMIEFAPMTQTNAGFLTRDYRDYVEASDPNSPDPDLFAGYSGVKYVCFRIKATENTPASLPTAEIELPIRTH